MTDVEAGSSLQRVTALLLLLVAGVVSLPLAAYLLDDEGSENWIIPAQLGGMAVVGALVGMLLPGLAGSGSSTRRAALVGAAVALLMAVVGVALFFLILNGFDGA